jgi:hypothetical protein
MPGQPGGAGFAGWQGGPGGGGGAYEFHGEDAFKIFEQMFGRVALTPGCQIGYMEHTGCRQLAVISCVEHTGCHQLVF